MPLNKSIEVDQVMLFAMGTCNPPDYKAVFYMLYHDLI